MNKKLIELEREEGDERISLRWYANFECGDYIHFRNQAEFDTFFFLLKQMVETGAASVTVG